MLTDNPKWRLSRIHNKIKGKLFYLMEGTESFKIYILWIKDTEIFGHRHLTVQVATTTQITLSCFYLIVICFWRHSFRYRLRYLLLLKILCIFLNFQFWTHTATLLKFMICRTVRVKLSFSLLLSLPLLSILFFKKLSHSEPEVVVHTYDQKSEAEGSQVWGQPQQYS